MNDEPKTKTGKTLDERLAQHPHLYEQMQRIADLMEKAIADGASADEAEELAIKQINDLGRALLTDWAQAQQARSVAEVRAKSPAVIQDSKKN